MGSSGYAQASGWRSVRLLAGLVAFVVLIGAGCGSDTETHSTQQKTPEAARRPPPPPPRPARRYRQPALRSRRRRSK